MKLIHLLSRIMGYAATAVLGLMMMLTVADVFMRYFLNSPITGTTEITELMLIIVVFPALAWCAINGQHLKVDLVLSAFPQRIQAIVDILTLFVTLIVLAIITWQSFLESMAVDSKTSLIKLPESPFYWVLTVGMTLFCVSIAGLVIEKIIREVKR